MRTQPGNCAIRIRRNHIFEDSYAEIMRQSPADLKKRLMIKFDGEDGLDYGGLSRYSFDYSPSYCIITNLNMKGNTSSYYLTRCSIRFTVYSNILRTTTTRSR